MQSLDIWKISLNSTAVSPYFMSRQAEPALRP